jgi:hypothetical protein
MLSQVAETSFDRHSERSEESLLIQSKKLREIVRPKSASAAASRCGIFLQSFNGKQFCHLNRALNRKR